MMARNQEAPHGAIRARQGEDDAAAVMTTGGGVGFEDALAKAHDTWVEGLRAQCKVPADWAYRRSPRATDEALAQVFELIGEGHYRIVSGNSFGGGTSLSIFISPEGMARLTSRASETEVLQGNAESPSSSDLNATSGISRPPE